jgi:sigma-B regulation protein RsbU (phosphoserine phosphatase)
MGAVLYYGLGLFCGGVIAWMLWWQGRRETLALDEEKQRLQDERKIVGGFMHDLVELIGQGFSREELMQQVVQAAVGSTGAMSACVFERQGNQLQSIAVSGLFPPHRPLPESIHDSISTRAEFLELVLRAEKFEVGEGLVGMVAQTGEGILIEDAENDPRVIKHHDPALHVRAVMVVPISFRDLNLAVLAIVNRSDGLCFDEVDFSLATSLAEQAGLALHNLALMDLQIERNRLEADLSLASNIQGLLLPSNFPSINGLALAGHYEPAQKVGGDLYDMVKIDEDRYGVVIADVAGKGVPASLIMAITQSNFGHFAKRHISPKATVCELNEVLYADTRQEMFVTLLYALIDLKHDTVTLVRAGHEPALMVRKSEEGSVVESITPRGMALGLVGEKIFSRALEEVVLPFREGDILFLYTDGITESPNRNGEEFGGRRLAAELQKLHQGMPEAINREVWAKVAAWTGPQAQSDDITLLSTKRTPQRPDGHGRQRLTRSGDTH